MKTFFLCAECKICDHQGEEYDDYVMVDDSPTTDVMSAWADRIRNRIRRLWMEDTELQKGVSVTLDAHMAFYAMLVDLQVILREDEGILIDFPELERHEILDENVKRILNKGVGNV